MSLPTISAAEAKRMLEQGAVLVDIRGVDEHARERIAGARNHPVDRIETIDSASRPVIFHCRTGNRTTVNAGKLRAATDCDAYIVEGGIDSWKKAGLPVVADNRQPIEIIRQVQITAGSLVLAGVILSALADGRFIYLSAFIGAGLLVAGVTGWCGMAKLFQLMPWNRRHPTAT